MMPWWHFYPNPVRNDQAHKLETKTGSLVLPTSVFLFFTARDHEVSEGERSVYPASRAAGFRHLSKFSSKQAFLTVQIRRGTQDACALTVPQKSKEKKMEQIIFYLILAYVSVKLFASAPKNTASYVLAFLYGLLIAGVIWAANAVDIVRLSVGLSMLCALLFSGLALSVNEGWFKGSIQLNGKEVTNPLLRIPLEILAMAGIIIAILRLYLLIVPLDFLLKKLGRRGLLKLDGISAEGRNQYVADISFDALSKAK